MKKILTRTLSMILAAGTLASCGAPAAAPASSAAAPTSSAAAPASEAASQTNGETKNLLLWMPPFGTEEALDKEVWGNIIAPFEQENNVKVSIEIVPWSNYEEKYLTGLSSGQGPDVGYMYMEMMNEYIDMGAIAPFDEYLTPEDKERFFYLDKGVIQGKQYAMPIVVGSARILYYNKEILDKAGVDKVPETWAEFTEACKKIAAIGVTPFQQQWGDKSKGHMNAMFFPYLWQAGGSIFSEDGTKAAFNSPEGIKAAQFIYDLRMKENIIPESATAIDESQLVAEFKAGNVAFAVLPTNKGAEFTEAGINWDYITSLKEAKMGTFVAADSLVLVSASKEKDLAVKLVKHMLSGSSMTEFHKMAPFPPVAKDEEYHDDERFKKIYEQDQAGLVSLPAVKGSAEVYDILCKNLQLMMLGEMTPEDALNSAAEYADNLLSQNQ